MMTEIILTEAVRNTWMNTVEVQGRRSNLLQRFAVVSSQKLSMAVPIIRHRDI